MSKVFIPDGYKSSLGRYDTQAAIEFIKSTFVRHFTNALNLRRVSAPLFVSESSGLNDNLNGVERPVLIFRMPITRRHRLFTRSPNGNVWRLKSTILRLAKVFTPI